MKIPANWPRPDWKKWGKAVWQRTRVYAVVLTVAAVGVGLYGAYLMHQMPKWQTETMAAAVTAAEQQPTQSASVQPQEQPVQTELTAAHVSPVRVKMPSDSEPAAADPTDIPETVEAQPEEPAEAVPTAAPMPTAAPAAEPPTAEAALMLEQAPRWVYVDPAKLTAAGEPCHGAQPSRGYGFTYDERYGDYRYHNSVTYAVASDRSVYAVRAGKVLSIDQKAQEIIIGDDSWQVIYQPVGDLTVSAGQTVTAGRALGNVPQDCPEFSLAVQQKQ